MKPFNLEEAKAGKPVVTRSGRAVRFGLFDRKHATFTLVGVVVQQDGTETPFQWKANGAWYDENQASSLDLFMATEKKTGWVNIYYQYSNTSKLRECGDIFPSEEKAKAHAVGNKWYVATIKIEWEE